MDTERIKINGQILHPDDIQQKLKTENLPDWEKSIYVFILNWFDASDFILQQTSGSTGTPKEIMLKKRAMVASAKKTIDFFNLYENQTAWLCLPINYIAGKMMVVRTIIGKLNLLITKPEGTPLIPDGKIDFTAMVPLQVQKLIDSNANFGTIQKLIIGGAATDASLIEKIQHLPTEIYASYGMTETCSHIALQRLNGSKPDKYFRILPGISISTTREDCLKVYAPEFSPELLETSDVVKLFSENEFKVIGRADNIINSGGIKISPEQLEEEFAKIINKECLVVPESDELLGQRIVLVLEGTYNKSLSEEYLMRIKNAIDKRRTPKNIYFIHEFPRNSSMKIDRKKVIQSLFSKR